MTHLTIYPDKPYEREPSNLAKWDRSNNYICQQKVDGWRMVIIVGSDDVDFVSRHNKLFTEEIQSTLREQAKQLCVLFPAGSQLDAEWLARRSCSVSNKIKGKVPSKLILFDILRLGKKWLRTKTYAERWTLLQKRLVKLDAVDILLSAAAEPGKFVEFYDEQKQIAHSEGVVVKHKRSKMIADRKECKKNPQWFKVKYRGGSDGEMSMNHLRPK